VNRFDEIAWLVFMVTLGGITAVMLLLTGLPLAP